MGQLDQKVAIVTGSDSGIGRSIALQLSSEGATVVVNYAHAREKAEAVLQVIEQMKGKALVIQATARAMVTHKRAGRIINISSVHEAIPMPQNVPYCCAKGGLRMLTRTICLELAPHTITVNNIAPGAVHTPIDADVEADPQKMAALLQGIPLHRMGKPEEIARLAAYLASDAAAYITGSTSITDGGVSVHTGAF